MTKLQLRFVITFLCFGLIAPLMRAPRAAESETGAAREESLLAVLRSDAPKSEQAITCKLLAIHGSELAVPDLAKLLPNPRLSSWARIALEAIPGEAADEALREATNTLTGDLLVGTINSIGVREDVAAIESLKPLVSHDDPQVAAAAAVALGKIGGSDARAALRESLASQSVPAAVRSAVAEGCVLCAERLHAEGKSSEAVALYDQIREADVPPQRVIEATRGAILARQDEGIPLLMDLLATGEKGLFYLALSTAREFPGNRIDAALADELGRLAPDRAALTLVAMADRPETVVLPAVVEAAESGPAQVRLAALRALGRVGNVGSLSTLLTAALADDAEFRAAARQAIVELEDEQVDDEIVRLLGEVRGESYPLLLELVGARRINAVPKLIEAVDHEHEDVRHAAIAALGETVSLKRLPLLISQMLEPRYSEDRAVAEAALQAASVRMPDRDACAAELAAAFTEASNEEKVELLEIIAEVGGDRALQIVSRAASSSAPELQDHGSRLLGKWNSLDAAPVLLELAKTAPERRYQIRALRGYLGLARKFNMPAADRAAMCRKAIAAASRPEEKQLALEVLTVRPSLAGLKLALETRQEGQVQEAATEAALAIAQRMNRRRGEARKLLSAAGLELPQ